MAGSTTTAFRNTVRLNVNADLAKLRQANSILQKIDRNAGNVTASFQRMNKHMNDAGVDAKRTTSDYSRQTNRMKRDTDSATRNHKEYANSVKNGESQVQRSFKQTELTQTRMGRSAQRNQRLVQASTVRMKHLGSTMSDVGRAASVASLGIGAGFVYSAKKAMALQNQYKVITNLAHYGGERMAEAQHNVNKMQREGTKYSERYGVSQKKISSGYEELIRRGYTSNQALAAQKTFLQGSIASGDDYADVVHNATAAIESFGLRSKNTGEMTKNTKKAVNQMAYAADLTATDFKGMGNGLQYVGSIAHGANQSLSETASALGVLSNNGQEASVAGTGLRQVLSRLTNPPVKGKYVTAMKRLGLTADDFKDSKGNLLSLQDIFEKLNKTMDKKGLNGTARTSIYGALFGQTGMTTATILGKNVKQLKELNGQVSKAQDMKGGGYIAQLSEKNMHTAQAQWNRFKETAMAVGIEMSKTLLPAAQKMLAVAADIGAKFTKLPKPIQEIGSYATIAVAAFGPLLLIAGKLVSAFAVLKGAAGTAGVAASTKTSLGNIGRNLGFSSGKTTVRKTAAATTGSRVARNASKYSKVGTAAVGVGIATSAGLDVYKAIKAKNPTKKFKSYGKAVGTALGGGIGFWFGGPAGAAVGAMIGRVVGGWAGKIAHTFSKTKMGRKISRSANASFKTIGKSAKSASNSVVRTFKKIAPSVMHSIKTIEHVIRPLGRFYKVYLANAAKTAVRVMGHAFETGLKIVAHIIKAIAGVVRGLSRSISGTVSLISDIFHGRWRKVLKDAAKIFSGFGKVIKSVLHGIHDVFHDTFSGMISIIKDVAGGIKGIVKDLSGTKTNNSMGYFNNPSKRSKTPKHRIRIQTGFATGGAISRTQLAMVGEQGRELAYNPRTGKYRILGQRGPAMEKVFAGERILNARDTAKAFAGGMGAGRILAGYAKGTAKPKRRRKAATVRSEAVSLDTTGLKNVTRDYKNVNDKSSKAINDLGKHSKKSWKDITKNTKKSSTKIQKNTVGDYNDMQKHSALQISQLNKQSQRSWRDINSDTKKHTQKIQTNTVGDFDDMQKHSLVQMEQLHKGMNSAAKATVSDFGSIFGRLDNYAHKAMGNAIHQLNGGISGINSVLGQFGGNHSVIKPIKYAKGSNGRIGSNQVAMLNDATSGPRQEAIVHNDGSLSLPQGRNAIHILQKGEAVLNGMQTQQLAQQGVIHYAKGSGVSKSGLRKIADKNSSHPYKAFNNEYNVHINVKGNNLQKGVTGLGKRTSSKYGHPWSKAMWNVIQDAIQGGAGAGGTWRHTPGLAVSDPFGASRASMYGAGAKHDGTDYSGPLGSAIRAIHGGTVSKIGGTGISDLGKVIIVKSDDGFKEIYQEFGQMHNIKVGVGDTIHTGQKIATLGNLVGAGSGPHVHIGVTKGNPLKMNMLTTHGWYDPTKMHGSSSGVKKSKKGDSRLTKLAKAELGKSALKWISKHLVDQDATGAGGGVKPTGSHAHWLKQAGMPESWWPWVNKIIGKESGWDPKADNPGSDAYGIPQALPGSKMASAGSDWRTNPITQLKWMKGYIKGRYGNAANAWRIRQTRGWYANGGWASQPSIFGEAGSEVAINPKRKSADSLIVQAISARAAASAESPFRKWVDSQKTAKQRQSLKRDISKGSQHRQPHANAVMPKIEVNNTFNISGDVSDEQATQAGSKLQQAVETAINKAFRNAYNKMEYGN